MFGPKITTVFRSRWNALFWAAGVLTTAYCSVPSEDEKDNSVVSAIVAQQAAQDTPHHANPWAKDSAN